MLDKMSREELRDVIRATVKETVRETLSEIGMDSTHPLDLQRDMSFLRDLRVARDSVTVKAMLVGLGVIVTAALGAIAVGIRHWFSSSP